MRSMVEGARSAISPPCLRAANAKRSSLMSASDPRVLLRSLFDAAVAAADPALIVPRASARAAQRANDRRRRGQGGGGDGGGGGEALARAAGRARSSPASAMARRRSGFASSRPDIRTRTRPAWRPRAKSWRWCTASRATISCSRSSPAAGRRCCRCRAARSRSPTSRRSPARCSRAARASAK